jgi:Asp-tRNA(Asn)/Glu-tRNA(Gln) amidotransferase A subunit family amidase
MALSWTMDKLGPICRAVEDTALVLNTIYGPDGSDRTVHDVAFNWDANLDWHKLRVGYFKEEFEFKPPTEPPAPTEEKPATPEEQKKREERTRARAYQQATRKYDQQFNDATLAKLHGMGANLIPLEVPKFPYGAMVPLLTAEAAAAFDDLTRSGRDKLLTEQSPDDWPNGFRIARLTPAVEYIQANRARMQAMELWRKLFDNLDVIVTPTGGQQLVATNLTGNPAVILPNGFRGSDAPKPPRKENGDDDGVGGPGTPVSLTFLGQLYGEAKLLAFAKAYQDATGFHLKHPDLDAELAKMHK